MRVLRWLMLLLLAVFSGVVYSAPQGDADLPACPSAAQLCRISQSWTVEQLRAEIGTLERGQGKFINREDELTLVYHATNSSSTGVSAYFSTGTMNAIPMQPVTGTDWWIMTVKLQFERADKALITFDVVDSGRFVSMTPWRGKNAPPAPPANHPLKGTQMQVPFASVALNTTRDVYIYLPPDYDSAQTYPVIYMTDGEELPDYAGLLDYLISAGSVPSTVMIGTASAQRSPERGYEYVPGRNPASFERHERFFIEEIRPWAQLMFNVSSDREDNILFGISNGGLFAVSMSVRHPELYGTILPFSAGASAGYEGIAIPKDRLKLPLHVYATAGTLEPIFHDTTRAFVRAYNAAGAYAEFSEGIAGHDTAMWQVEFVNALKWLYVRKEG